MNLQFRTNSKIQMSGSYQDQTKLEKPREYFVWSSRKVSDQNVEVFLLKASRNVATLVTIYHYKKRKDERYVIKKICPSDVDDFYCQYSFKVRVHY